MTIPFILLLIANIGWFGRALFHDKELLNAKKLYDKILKESIELNKKLEETNAQTKEQALALLRLNEEMDAKISYIDSSQKQLVKAGWVNPGDIPTQWQSPSK